jgi:hypothetical protein
MVQPPATLDVLQEWCLLNYTLIMMAFMILWKRAPIHKNIYELWHKLTISNWYNNESFVYKHGVCQMLCKQNTWWILIFNINNLSSKWCKIPRKIYILLDFNKWNTVPYTLLLFISCTRYQGMSRNHLFLAVLGWINKQQTFKYNTIQCFEQRPCTLDLEKKPWLKTSNLIYQTFAACRWY